MKYPKLDLETVEAIVDKIGGMKVVEVLLSGALEMRPAVNYPVFKKTVFGDKHIEFVSATVSELGYVRTEYISVIARKIIDLGYGFGPREVVNNQRFWGKYPEEPFPELPNKGSVILFFEVDNRLGFNFGRYAHIFRDPADSRKSRSWESSPVMDWETDKAKPDDLLIFCWRRPV